jgi:hypothetical protein
MKALMAENRADRQCPVCLKWFMTKVQRDHHVEIRHKVDDMF